MSVDYQVGGVSHNAFDIDADAYYLYLAVLDSSNSPQILKLRADLSSPATVSYDPGSGSEVNLMAGDLSSYWVWASGNFGGTNRVVATFTGGQAWYIQDDGTLVGTARPILVGPGDDALVTTSGGTILYQNRFEGATQYWVDRNIPFSVWALDRVDINFEDIAVGAYWYSGLSQLVEWSPSSGLLWGDITAGLPDVTITSIVLGS